MKKPGLQMLNGREDVCVCAYVCVCVRACMWVCVGACSGIRFGIGVSIVFLFFFDSLRGMLLFVCASDCSPLSVESEVLFSWFYQVFFYCL